MATAPTPAVTISEHAILRYLERVYGIDMEHIRAELSSPVAEMAVRMNAPSIRLRSGHRAMIRDGVVTTILSKPKHRGRV
ncbi:hypothetical protein [Sphingomonas crocodyli]|uniref:Uncharacterized protein n=1 Tax=Sphingomonas crocodyli TaxID=1979270 RepID=A0A437M7K2_9SPHN|nr:hypothetical protein [Sphingomonas crocodyli]RVT93711.1 hypothetical protein EOD43_07550 [Sphingomonas crocodyli]